MKHIFISEMETECKCGCSCHKKVVSSFYFRYFHINETTDSGLVSTCKSQIAFRLSLGQSFLIFHQWHTKRLNFMKITKYKNFAEDTGYFLVLQILGLLNRSKKFASKETRFKQLEACQCLSVPHCRPQPTWAHSFVRTIQIQRQFLSS